MGRGRRRTSAEQQTRRGSPRRSGSSPPCTSSRARREGGGRASRSRRTPSTRPVVTPRRPPSCSPRPKASGTRIPPRGTPPRSSAGGGAARGRRRRRVALPQRARASWWTDGPQGGGRRLLRSALALAVDGNHVEAAVAAYWALGATANDWADYATAQAAFDDALVYCRANHLSDDEHFCVGCLAVVLETQGTGRARSSSRALSSTTLAARRNAAHAQPTLGLIAAARGATKRGRGLLTRALATAREPGCWAPSTRVSSASRSRTSWKMSAAPAGTSS